MPDNAESTSEPFRILMTADAVGGVWQYSVDLVSGLVARGAEVLLATFGPRPSADQRERIASLPGATLAESDYALEWMPEPWRDVDAGGNWLLHLQKDFQADVIHLNGYSHASLVWEKPVVVVAHSCVYSWWRAVYGCAPGPEWAEYKRRVGAGLATATAIAAPSAFMASAIQNEYGLPPERIRVIHNFSHSPQSYAGEKEHFFLAAGRLWDPAKNLDLLRSIAPKLPWQIRVAGNDRGPEHHTPATQSVRFLGPLEHSRLMREMRRASVYLHPAVYEPFGLSVLEAAHARCCLVLADIPSLRELWDGVAVFIDPHDPERWIFELNRLTQDSVERESFARAAQVHSRSYSCAVIEQYWSLYRQLAQSQRRAREAAA